MQSILLQRYINQKLIYLLSQVTCAQLEQAQYYTDLPLQITFPGHAEQEKMGPAFKEKLPLIRSEKETRIPEKREIGEQKIEYRQTILDKVHAAHLLSFRGTTAQNV